MCAIAFRTEPTKAGFARYTAAMAGNFPVATGLLWLCVVPLRLPVIFVSPIVTLVMFGINFIMSRWAIAKPKAPCGY
jgi:putative flippase GtrA